ncbi:cbb3-type cytochrome oxidase assembly protein CcoS [Elioraea tepida]|jgi:cbb3-type cytochrome oxidase maturation protein|uniref:Cbb3-type cytochrome oxidase assembly protein CcoS n=1 Tax=Elioraea tepida TaxID=2843330 RepID=A0A975U2X6_9PROT|nr:cbb3-type cytochrome oxidase assembly protein CcoS [Elioraea tepida]QXM24111.1 cbb3-type cytochrome oxidase assembly protein CcoS [Elioraea tepida]
MDALILLIPLSLLLAGLALAGFLWTVRSGQYDDLEAVASRVLFEDEMAPPQSPQHVETSRETTR